MTKFQVILIASMVFILISYFRRFRQQVLDKIFICLMLAVGIFLVLNPEKSSQLAHFFGIGRGADLIFYLAIIGFGYIAFVLYSKIKKLEDQLKTLVQKQALESIKPLSQYE